MQLKQQQCSNSQAAAAATHSITVDTMDELSRL
jgi:hypothetical protein